MSGHSRFTRCLCSMLAAVFLAMTTALPMAQAGMIGTQQMLAAERAAEARQTSNAALERADVQAQLEAFGVSPDDARERVASLSDAEAQQLARHAGQLPAGGNALGAVIGAVVFVFIVLLITDILGFTDVFPFVTKSVR